MRGQREVFGYRVKCQCARCGRMWVTHAGPFLDLRGEVCPRCKHGVFAIEPVEVITHPRVELITFPKVGEP